MLIAGVNAGNTRDGRHLKDGAACLVIDGEPVVGVAEERLTSEKHAGGFSRALPYCLQSEGATIPDLDMIVVSTCAEEPLENGCDIGIAADASKVVAVPSHHLSHAYAAFFTSPFDHAAIMILDNEGTIIGPQRDNVYWNNRVERNSYYLGNGNCITRLDEADDDLDDLELGPGEAYRHFTYFLGWPSYVYAGKTMGLAPLGRREAYRDLKVFELEEGRIHSLLRNGRGTPPTAVTELAIASGTHVGPPRAPTDPITVRHGDIAAAIQRELEKALMYKAEQLHRLTGARNLCIGGGVALNCVANRQILDCTPFERLYVCPAPGDTGQCLGNALYGWIGVANQPRRTGPLSPYLGRSYSELEIHEAIAAAGDRIVHEVRADIARKAAQIIADGCVVGWFQGKSELGPRALGARSILADPRYAAMQDYLNVVVKKREPFRPFAPSVLEGEAGNFFDLPCPSPFMELTATVLQDVRHLIPAVTHVDGSSRPQTVTPEQNRLFAEVIGEFRGITGLPLVLNTSFNLGGDPIVESPQDAIACFLNSELDTLVIGDVLVRRSGESSSPRFQRWASSMPA